MPTLDATPGATTANSYVTLQDAAAFLAERLHVEPWFTQEALPQLAPALIWATHLLDEQVQWYGVPRTTTQALAWPMAGQVDSYGRVLSETTVPLIVQRATAFYALALLRDQSEAADASTAQQRIKSRKLGDTTITYQDQPAQPPRPLWGGLPLEIRQMLRPYGRMAGSMTVSLLRT